jgi:hypothetical protein
LVRWDHPVLIPVDLDFRMYDRDGKFLLCTYRGSYPSELHEYMNNLMSEIYLAEESSWDFTKQPNRGMGFVVEAKHYGPHPYGWKRKTEKDEGLKYVILTELTVLGTL